MRRAILIAGMHRSGTSAVAGLIGTLGAGLPKHLLGADSNNEKGHWESELLLGLNERILHAAGSRWDDWRCFDPAALGEDARTDFVAELATTIAGEYGDAELIVIKDPRLSRLAPLYVQALANLGIAPAFLLPFRNPIDVIASHARRDAMTAGFAEFIWLSHVLDAERATRQHVRSAISYEQLLADWRAAAGKVARDLGLEWPRSPDAAAREIEALLTSELRHHAADREQIFADPTLTGWTKAAYSALERLAAADEGAIAEFDRIGAEFSPMAAAFGRAAFPELLARESKLAGLAEIRQSLIDSAAEETRQLREELVRLKTIAAACQAEIEGLIDEAGANAREMDGMRNARNEALARIAGLETRSAELEAGKVRAETALAAIAGSRTWRWTAPVRDGLAALRDIVKGRSRR